MQSYDSFVHVMIWGYLSWFESQSCVSGFETMALEGESEEVTDVMALVDFTKKWFRANDMLQQSSFFGTVCGWLH